MYRNKSAVSLRTLAHSLKHSITMDRNKAQSREFKPLRSSASSMNLLSTNYGNKHLTGSNTVGNNANEQYLIMLQTRKSSKLPDKNFGNNRDSNYSQVRYDIRATRELMMHKKQRLLQMTRAQSTRRFPIATESRSALPQPYKQSDQITCTLSLLHQQESRLKQLLQQKYSLNGLKSSHKHISESQVLCKQLKQISTKHNQFISYKSELQNRLMFLQQQISSTEMNFNEYTGEKQLCESFLSTYQQENEFREQAENAMKLIQLQYETQHNIYKENIQLQQQLHRLQTQYNSWRVQENIQVKEKTFSNKLKELKIDLMKIQQDIDAITDQLILKFAYQNLPDKTIRKIRQYICTYFWKYNQLNANRISHAQVSDGMDIFLCKEGLVKDFTQFFNEKTQKLSLINGMYSLKLTQYCECLKKIQHLFHVQKTQLNKVISTKFQEQIISIKQQIQSLISQKQENLSEIQSLQQNIEKILTNDSLSIIQVMSKNGSSTELCFNKQQGFFNFPQIKTKVKEIKKEQQKRINKASQKFIRLKQLEEIENKYIERNSKNTEKLSKQKQALIFDIKLWEKKVQEISVIKQGYELKKAKCDNFIDGAVTKMKEKDEAQQKLMSIQNQIQNLKKEKIQQITKKHQTRKLNEQLTNFEDTKPRIRPFSSVNNLNDCLKSTWCKRTDSYKPESKLQLQTHKINPYQQTKQDEENVSAEFKFTRDLKPINQQFTFDEQKMSIKTQSSPKNCKQRLSLGALNSILLSKCNLISSKNLQTKSKSFKNSASTYGVKIMNKENQFHSDELLLESKPHSRKNSNVSKKQNISRKTSMSKNTQRSPIKNQPSNQNTATKLSLSTNTRKPSLNKFPSQSKQSPYTKPQKPFQKDLNSMITNKLLRR